MKFWIQKVRMNNRIMVLKILIKVDHE